MTTTGANTPAQPTTAAEETPWYELLDVPEPPEDGVAQDELITRVNSILTARYANDPSTHVAGPLTFVIYDSERPGSFVAPDCFVVFGVDDKTITVERLNYRIDEWGVPPAFVLEVASPSTAARDLGEKRAIYARMGAQEYWRLDRMGDNYGEPLVGERLVDGEYVRFELHTEPDGDIWSHSEALGVDFFYRIEDGVGTCLLRDSATGEWMNNLTDEIAARQAAEARNRELKAEVERLRQQLGQE